MDGKRYDKLFDEFQEIDLSDAILTTYNDGTNDYRMDSA